MTNHEVVKYRKPIRILHWIHSGAFLLLFLTGLVLFIPALGFLAEDSWTRLIHRIGAAIFVIIPIIYLIINPKAVGRGFKLAFSVGNNFGGWLKALPRYYFLGDESQMPAQDALNTGEKLWWLTVIIFGIIFVITGIIMWFFKTSAPPALLLWMTFIHDVAFIAIGCFFFIHLFLAIFHPLMTEAWSAMANGKISTEYAKAHHGKWYAEISKGKEESA